MSDKCIEYRSQIPAYLEGNLDGGPSERLEAHLDGCPDCSGALEREMAVRLDHAAPLDAALAELSALPEVPCPEAVIRRIEEATAGAEPGTAGVDAPGDEAASVRDPDRHPFRRPGLFRVPFGWRAALAGAAVLAAVLLYLASPFTARPPGEPPAYTHEEVMRARAEAREGLVLTARLMRQAENNVIKEVLSTDLPYTVRIPVFKTLGGDVAEAVREPVRQTLTEELPMTVRDTIRQSFSRI